MRMRREIAPSKSSKIKQFTPTGLCKCQVDAARRFWMYQATEILDPPSHPPDHPQTHPKAAVSLPVFREGQKPTTIDIWFAREMLIANCEEEVCEALSRDGISYGPFVTVNGDLAGYRAYALCLMSRTFVLIYCPTECSECRGFARDRVVCGVVVVSDRHIAG